MTTFVGEPQRPHGQRARTAVLLINLGTPQAPTAPAVKRYLAEFLSDPRVVEIPRPLWALILHGVILRVRPRKSAAKYAKIWTPEGSPLAVWTERQALMLRGYLGERGANVLVRHAMRYGSPSVSEVLDELKRDGAQRILVLPLYPQYAAATTATANDAVMAWSLRQRRQPEFRFVTHYHDDAGYIEALAQRLLSYWHMHGRGDRLVLSFHGVPRRSLTLGDPYFCECHKTARLLRERLNLDADQVAITFQSRFGRAKWLEPYTEPSLVALAESGVRRVDVMCPGFASDCLETLEEISLEARAAFLTAGGQEFHYVPALNDDPQWIKALTALSLKHLQGWDLTGATDLQEANAQIERAKALGASA